MKKLLCALVAVAGMAIATSLSFSQNSASGSTLTLADIEALSAAETCMSGGTGAASCKHSGSILVIGVSVSYDCEVTCHAGYYACCNLTCYCVENGK